MLDKREFMDLQLFAESDDTEPKDPEAKDPPKDPAPEKPEPKYTDEDVNKLIDQKFAEWQKKTDEAKKLAEMNAQQRAEHERERLEKQVEELTRKQTLAEMSKSARAMLSERNLNVGDELLTMLISDDADQTKKSVDSFIALFQSELKKAVAEALKGNVPRTGTPSNISKEDIMKVENRAERQRLIRENIELFGKRGIK